MDKLTIGLIREGKTPPDKRVAFTPAQAEEIEQRFPGVKVVCQTSDVRAFRDEEYRDLGIEVASDLRGCDVLVGIKEVQVRDLVDEKTYLFFSHTLKKQPYNRKLLQEILRKNISLIDYEALKDHHGNRLVAFGRFAGIVGAYNALWAYGRRFNLFALRRAYECFDVNDLKRETGQTLEQRGRHTRPIRPGESQQDRRIGEIRGGDMLGHWDRGYRDRTSRWAG